MFVVSCIFFKLGLLILLFLFCVEFAKLRCWKHFFPVLDNWQTDPEILTKHQEKKQRKSLVRWAADRPTTCGRFYVFCILIIFTSFLGNFTPHNPNTSKLKCCLPFWVELLLVDPNQNFQIWLKYYKSFRLKFDSKGVINTCVFCNAFSLLPTSINVRRKNK